MTYVQKLDLKKVKRAARKYYEAGLLLAQHPRKNRRFCKYHDGEYRCAIGAALSKKSLAKIDAAEKNYAGVYGIEHLVDMTSGKLDISDIQGLHDEWCNISRENGAKSEEAQARKIKFLEAIGIK